MESRAKLLGYPIHPMLIVFPLGLLATASRTSALRRVGASRAASWSGWGSKEQGATGSGWCAGCGPAAAPSSRWTAPPGRRARRGKSDAVDAEAAARAVLAGTATGQPKTSDGRVEMIRALRVARRSAVTACTQAANQPRALVVTAPDALRARLRALPRAGLVAAARGLRVGACPRTPALIFHGDRDFLQVDVARTFHAALAQRGVPVTMLEFRGAGHGLEPFDRCLVRDIRGVR